MRDNAESFPPIVGMRIHTLILGTVPGQASLNATEYYAHPRNAFWPIMIALVNDEQPSYDSARMRSYIERCKLLSDNGYAIWDVLASCTRPGSLDSKIVKGSEQPNDIASLVQNHPELIRIVCNGRTAETLFKRHIGKSLPRPIYFDEAKIATSKITVSKNAKSEITTSKVAEFEDKEIPANAIRLLSLPSTSPAMASLTLADKYQVWADGLLG